MPAGRTLVSHRTMSSIVIALGAAAAVALVAGAARAQSPGGIAGVVAPGVVPELVQEGFVFTEGPVGTPDGGLHFSDIRPNRIHYLDPGGKDQPGARADQRRERAGADARRRPDCGGRRGKRISRRSRDGGVTTVTEGIAGKPFLSPNDVLVDANGGIYITDPGPRPVVPGRTAYVYYLPAGAKEPIVIDDQIARPNGITLTRDGKTLIVNDTLGPTVYAYDVQPDGSVKNKRTFAQLRDIPEGKESGADGMALDREDRLYVTTVAGVQVFDAARTSSRHDHSAASSRPMQISPAGQARAYVKAREGLYRINMLAQGPIASAIVDASPRRHPDETGDEDDCDGTLAHCDRHGRGDPAAGAIGPAPRQGFHQGGTPQQRGYSQPVITEGGQDRMARRTDRDG